MWLATLLMILKITISILISLYFVFEISDALDNHASGMMVFVTMIASVIAICIFGNIRWILHLVRTVMVAVSIHMTCFLAICFRREYTEPREFRIGYLTFYSSVIIIALSFI